MAISYNKLWKLLIDRGLKKNIIGGLEIKSYMNRIVRKKIYISATHKSTATVSGLLDFCNWIFDSCCYGSLDNKHYLILEVHYGT